MLLIMPSFNKPMFFTHITVQMDSANCNWLSLVIWHLDSPSCVAEIFHGLLSVLCIQAANQQRAKVKDITQEASRLGLVIACISPTHIHLARTRQMA